MKKFFSLVLALVMALSLTTIAWGADAADLAGLKANLTAGEVKLTADININVTDGTQDRLVIAQDLVVDLNGHKLYSADAADDIFYVQDGASLTVKNGTLDSARLGIYSNGSGTDANIIKLDNVDIYSDYFGVYHNGNNYGADVTIENSTIIDNGGAGVFLSGSKAWAPNQLSKLTITNSTVQGDTAVEAKYANVTVNNSTLIATGTAGLSANNNGMASSGYALVLTHSGAAGVEEAAKGSITVNSGTITGAVGIQETGDKAVGTVVAETANTTDATIAVKGGTFTDDVSAYLASGVVLIGGAVKAQSTDKYDLHKADATGTLWAQNYTLTPVAAVKNADGTGTVAHYVDSYNVKVIEIPAAQAKVTDYYVTAPGSTVPVKYLREVAVVDYAYTVAAFTNLGTACGQVNNTLTPTADYYTVTVGTAKDTVYMEGTTGAYALAGNEIVQLNATPATKNAHTWVASGMTKGVVTSAVCAKCGAPAAVYTSISKIPAGSAYVTLTTALGANGEIYVVPAGAAVVPSTPSTDKVTSAETFDAGIAMYVGMSVMAAAGSVVVLKKRED